MKWKSKRNESGEPQLLEEQVTMGIETSSKVGILKMQNCTLTAKALQYQQYYYNMHDSLITKIKSLIVSSKKSVPQTLNSYHFVGMKSCILIKSAVKVSFIV